MAALTGLVLFLCGWLFISIGPNNPISLRFLAFTNAENGSLLAAIEIQNHFRRPAVFFVRNPEFASDVGWKEGSAGTDAAYWRIDGHEIAQSLVPVPPEAINHTWRVAFSVGASAPSARTVPQFGIGETKCSLARARRNELYSRIVTHRSSPI